MQENLENEPEITIRRLRPDDMDAVVALDAKVSGRRREEYFKAKLAMALSYSGIEVSLAAIVDNCLVGFLLAQVYYGEFGTTEKTAVLDTLDVHPRFRGRGVGHALIDQLKLNLQALRIHQLSTSVGWQDQELLSFFYRSGFVPDAKISLSLEVC